jgi:mannose/fructose-specific phosphotransferase system component IIA
MEVKIGVQNANRELVIDSGQSSDDVEAQITKALASEDGVLVLSDVKGRKVIVPINKLAYVEVGSPSVGQVGFRS